jgi:flagellar biosynthetic protein FlhB
VSVAEEKTEAPTAKKRRESRKEGQVARTPEFGAWAALMVFGLVLDTAGGWEVRALRSLMTRSFELVATPEPAKAMHLLGGALMQALIALVALGTAVMLVGVSAALGQGGFFLATKAVMPKFSKLNPVNGAKRIFGPHSLWEAVKVIVKSAVVGLICFNAIRAMMPLIGGLVPPEVTLDLLHGRVAGLLRSVAVAGLVMAAGDYAFQRRRTGKQTRMTKHEVKQEAKQTEGNPLVKSAIRSRQLAAARSRMMADIPTADVVLVNPTHVAVALKYDPAGGAPKVVARGAGAVATKIREKAEEARVPLVRDVPLARALYGSCKVGQEIPIELFAAVAQVLAFVIGRRAQGQRGGSMDSPRVEPHLPVVPRVRVRRNQGPSSA